MSQSKSSAPSSAADRGVHHLVIKECSKRTRLTCHPTAYQAAEVAPSEGLDPNDTLAVTMTFGLDEQPSDPGGQTNWENRHAHVLQRGSLSREHFSSIIHKALKCIHDDYKEFVKEVPGTFYSYRQSIDEGYWRAQCERQPSAGGQTVFRSSWTLKVWYDRNALRLSGQLSKSDKSDKKGGSSHKKSKDKDRKPRKLDEWAQSKDTGFFF